MKVLNYETPSYETPLLDLHGAVGAPVVIDKVWLHRWRDYYFVRCRSRDGAEGVTVLGARGVQLHAIFNELVIPYFIGKDARDLEVLIDGVYAWELNYKLAGPAFWMCVSWVEAAVLDLLGKVAGKPIAELLGGRRHAEVPVYVSSLRRDTTPEQEIAWVGDAIGKSGATAVKLKIGGRLSRNSDSLPGRSEQLVTLARKTWGDGMRIFIDANGSYDPPHAVEAGRMLASHGVEFFEEPCPFEDLDATKLVADALDLPVAGGEQDASLPRFHSMARHRVIDILQPDLAYLGGFVRTGKVARLAREHGLPVIPHSPYTGPRMLVTLQSVATLPQIDIPMEFNATLVPEDGTGWYTPSLEVRNGAVSVPTGPGLGIEYAPEVLQEG
jgi:L-alanine-DL-glutamate epimerase-like enolase superfamily enzyme